MRTYVLVYEALVRMLLKKYESQLPQKVKDTIQEIVDVPGINIDVTQNTKRKILIDALLEDTDFCDYIDNIFTKVEMTISDMAKYWLSFLEMVDILFMHYHAMRTQNWKEYLTVEEQSFMEQGLFAASMT